MACLAGCSDQDVFGGQGLSLARTRLQLDEGLAKVREGVVFLGRGVKLLGSDVGNSGRLFWKAASGAPRQHCTARHNWRAAGPWS